MYVLRTEEGDMKALLPDSIVQRLADEDRGFWREYPTRDGGTAQALQVKTDTTFRRAGITLHLWAGDKLNPDAPEQAET